MERKNVTQSSGAEEGRGPQRAVCEILKKKIVLKKSELQETQGTPNEWKEDVVQCDILPTETLWFQPIAVRPAFVSHEPMCLILSGQVRSTEPLKRSHAEISRSAVNPTGQVTADVKETRLLNLRIQENSPACL